MTMVTPESLTRLVRRAANAIGVAVVAWFVLFFVSSEVAAVRAVSPWSEDPPDLVVSLAFLLLGVVGPVTFVRVQQDAGTPFMRPRTADDVMRGLYVALGAVGVADAVMFVAWLREGGATTASPGGALLGALLGISIATAAIATALVVNAARATAAWRRSGGPVTRDALDDIVAWVGRIRPLRGVAGALAGVLEGPFSPRRHRSSFAVLVAVGFGLTYSTWHLIVEGPAPSPGAAITILLVFAGFGAAAVLAGWIAFGGYLRLIRRDPA